MCVCVCCDLFVLSLTTRMTKKTKIYLFTNKQEKHNVVRSHDVLFYSMYLNVRLDSRISQHNNSNDLLRLLEHIQMQILKMLCKFLPLFFFFSLFDHIAELLGGWEGTHINADNNNKKKWYKNGDFLSSGFRLLWLIAQIKLIRDDFRRENEIKKDE